MFLVGWADQGIVFFSPRGPARSGAAGSRAGFVSPLAGAGTLQSPASRLISHGNAAGQHPIRSFLGGFGPATARPPRLRVVEHDARPRRPALLPPPLVRERRLGCLGLTSRSPPQPLAGQDSAGSGVGAA